MNVLFKDVRIGEEFTVTSRWRKTSHQDSVCVEACSPWIRTGSTAIFSPDQLCETPEEIIP